MGARRMPIKLFQVPQRFRGAPRKLRKYHLGTQSSSGVLANPAKFGGPPPHHIWPSNPAPSAVNTAVNTSEQCGSVAIGWGQSRGHGMFLTSVACLQSVRDPSPIRVVNAGTDPHCSLVFTTVVYYMYYKIGRPVGEQRIHSKPW